LRRVFDLTLDLQLVIDFLGARRLNGEFLDLPRRVTYPSSALILQFFASGERLLF
jgi:hypothetical protein